MPPDVADEHRLALERFYDAFNARDEPRILAGSTRRSNFESRFAQAGGTAVHELSWRDGKLASLRYAERTEAGAAE